MVDQAEIRREVFRDAIQGIGRAIRNNQIPSAISWAQEIPGQYGSAETLADELERTAANERVTVAQLRHLRQKLKTATEGTDEIDEAVRRIYYATVFERQPTSEALLPPGSPSRSIDIAAFIVQRILPNGWWTMGSNCENLSEPPVAKVGAWSGDNPKPETGTTTPIALLSALVLTMIAAAKKDG